MNRKIERERPLVGCWVHSGINLSRRRSSAPLNVISTSWRVLMYLHRFIPNKVSASISLELLGTLTLVACGGGSAGNQTAAQASSGFSDTALVSDKTGVVAATTTIDANLSNPWGVALAPGLPF